MLSKTVSTAISAFVLVMPVLFTTSLMMSSFIKAASSKLHDRIEVIPVSSRSHPPLLFVYGTLQSSFQNSWAKLLRDSADLLGQARVRGRLYQVAHYPGLKMPDRPDQWVEGELYRLRNPAKILMELDRWEGPQYERVFTTAHFMNAAPRACWVYLYLARVDPALRILSGRFKATAPHTDGP
jgi:gamma-glutamylcyclotransferase (GGCT)/AIG2-like uncharacterized protein YtfP